MSAYRGSVRRTAYKAGTPRCERKNALQQLAQRVFYEFIYNQPVGHTFTPQDIYVHFNMAQSQRRRVYDVLKIAQRVNLLKKDKSRYARTGKLGFEEEKHMRATAEGSVFWKLAQNAVMPGIPAPRLVREFRTNATNMRRVYDTLAVLCGAGIITAYKHEEKLASHRVKRARHYVFSEHILREWYAQWTL